MSDAIIDACCLINFCASGDLEGTLSAMNWSWHVTRLAMAESTFIRVVDENGDTRLERITFDRTLATGALKVCEIEGEQEAGLYVRLAADLDDGEAMALAIAKGRGWFLATDDKKARRIAMELGAQVVTTPQVMRRWAEAGRVGQSVVRSVLQRIEFGARFSPSEGSPEGEWWTRLTS
jgi:predicted nucleic acid-binding protein